MLLVVYQAGVLFAVIPLPALAFSHDPSLIRVQDDPVIGVDDDASRSFLGEAAQMRNVGVLSNLPHGFVEA
jgi:hypothetical protein